jgi:hypothetical protein
VVIYYGGTLEIGSVVPIHKYGTRGIPGSDATAVVIAETNKADMLEQEKLFGMSPLEEDIVGGRYYRCIAE